MSSCQDLLPGFLPSCVPGEQFPFCSHVCRFSAECTVFTAGDQILISILLCSPFVLPPASDPKIISAPLRGDGFWEKLFGLSSLTKTRRDISILSDTFQPQQQLQNTSDSPHAEINLVHLLTQVKSCSQKKKKFHHEFLQSQNTSFASLFRRENVQLKVVSVDVFTDVFFFLLKASAKVAGAASLQLPNRCPLPCVLSATSVFLSDVHSLPWIFPYEKRTFEKHCRTRNPGVCGFQVSESQMPFPSSEFKDTSAPWWLQFHRGKGAASPACSTTSATF